MMIEEERKIEAEIMVDDIPEFFLCQTGFCQSTYRMVPRL